MTCHQTLFIIKILSGLIQLDLILSDLILSGLILSCILNESLKKNEVIMRIKLNLLEILIVNTISFKLQFTRKKLKYESDFDISGAMKENFVEVLVRNRR